ncbi:MAG: DUF4405 domain-containing protein [Mariniphaga sp.]|nr:DUF4405 domain-containing protein [Mariniphaga sp.]MDD4227020.1 DUF4405 domain-containing protein [Mariniphaga sp.]MDD4425480.1 DUF4405 domain-containing protein [Mariniphaga sp.]
MKPLLRQKINIVIDLVMFVVMAALAVVGILIRYVLLSGEKRWEIFGNNLDMTFWGLDRHQWGRIHMILGILLIVLLVLHIVLHWTQIVCMVNRLLPGRTVRMTLLSGLGIICLFIFLSPFMVKPELGEPIRREGERRGRVFSRTAPETQSLENEEKLAYPVKNEVQVETSDARGRNHSGDSRLFDIRGYHTLAELSEIYHVPVGEMKSTLHIPPQVSENERVGRIRRIYGFTLREVEDCILELQKTP